MRVDYERACSGLRTRACAESTIPSECSVDDARRAVALAVFVAVQEPPPIAECARRRSSARCLGQAEVIDTVRLSGRGKRTYWLIYETIVPSGGDNCRCYGRYLELSERERPCMGAVLVWFPAGGICAVRSVEKCEDRLRRAETLCLRYTRDARVRRDGTRAKGASCGASRHAGK